MELSVPIKSIRSFFALQKEMESTQDGLYSFMEKFQLSLPLGFYFALDLLKSENFGQKSEICWIFLYHGNTVLEKCKNMLH